MKDRFSPSGNFLPDNPCRFRTYPRDTVGAPLDIDLNRLNLGALELLEEQDVTTLGGGRRLAYRVNLTDHRHTGYVELTNRDSARRSANAFGALAKRCGARSDARLR